jgi:hypothetical protein
VTIIQINFLNDVNTATVLSEEQLPILRYALKGR